MAWSDKLDLENMFEYNEVDFIKDSNIFLEIVDYAKKNDIHSIDSLVDIDEGIFDIFEYLDSRVSNTNVMKIDMKDLSKVLSLYDNLVEVFYDDEDILTLIIQKMSILFKMRKNDHAEECMLKYIRSNPNDGRAYLELMFALDAIAHDRESAIYYGNLALENDDLDDKAAIEEFLEDLEG